MGIAYANGINYDATGNLLYVASIAEDRNVMSASTVAAPFGNIILAGNVNRQYLFSITKG